MLSDSLTTDIIDVISNDIRVESTATGHQYDINLLAGAYRYDTCGGVVITQCCDDVARQMVNHIQVCSKPSVAKAIFKFVSDGTLVLILTCFECNDGLYPVAPTGGIAY